LHVIIVNVTMNAVIRMAAALTDVITLTSTCCTSQQLVSSSRS